MISAPSGRGTSGQAKFEAAEWLDRDRSWKEELASALKLTEAQEQDVDRAGLSEALPETFREAARLPAVRAAIRQQIARLDRSPAPQRGMAWTGDEPLVAGDHIAWRAGGTMHHTAVAFPGDTGGMRASDTLLLRIARPAVGRRADWTPIGALTSCFLLTHRGQHRALLSNRCLSS